MMYKILSEEKVSYIKWDMNRSITECCSAALPADRQGEVFHLSLIHILEAHSDHVYYRDANEMQTAVQDGTETSFRYSLNGLWKFHYARNYKSAVRCV